MVSVSLQNEFQYTVYTSGEKEKEKKKQSMRHHPANEALNTIYNNNYTVL